MTKSQATELAKLLDIYTYATRVGNAALAKIALRNYRRVALALAQADPHATAVTLPDGEIIPVETAEGFNARYTERFRSMMGAAVIV